MSRNLSELMKAADIEVASNIEECLGKTLTGVYKPYNGKVGLMFDNKLVLVFMSYLSYEDSTGIDTGGIDELHTEALRKLGAISKEQEASWQTEIDERENEEEAIAIAEEEKQQRRLYKQLKQKYEGANNDPQ